MVETARRRADAKHAVGLLKPIDFGPDGGPVRAQRGGKIVLVAVDHLARFVRHARPNDFDAPHEKRVGRDREAKIGSAVLRIHEPGAGKVEPSRAPNQAAAQIDRGRTPRVSPVERRVRVAAVEFDGEVAAG